jgi:hypothetical protein
VRFADLKVRLLAPGGTAVTVRDIEYSCQKEICRDGDRLAHDRACASRAGSRSGSGWPTAYLVPP